MFMKVLIQKKKTMTVSSSWEFSARHCTNKLITTYEVNTATATISIFQEMKPNLKEAK